MREWPKDLWLTLKQILLRFSPSLICLFEKCIGLCFRESCGEGSVKILEDRLEALGFQHNCIDDYR